MIPDWLNESYLPQFPEELQAVAQKIGFNNLLKLMDDYRSTDIYFPRLDFLTNKVRNNSICKEFNGSNQKELARKYNLSPRYIYDIIAKAREKSDTKNIEHHEEEEKKGCAEA